MTMSRARLMMPFPALLVAILAGCGGGPDIIGGHDYSSFYDFGGGGDTAEPDNGTGDAFIRDIDLPDESVVDTSGDDVSIDDTSHADTGKNDTSTTDTSTDTTASGPTVVFVTDRAWETRAKSMIAGAKQSVDVVHLEFLMYSPEDISIADSLENAAGHGVDVRVLLDDDVDDNFARVDGLEVAGIDAKLDNWNGTTHVKMIIVDDSQVLVGSTNLSKSSLHFNHEANLWITDKAAVPEYVDYFDALWADPDQKEPMGATMTGSGIQAIGDGEYVDAVSGYLDNATARIWVVMYDFSWYSANELGDRLLDAENRGVEVKVFLENSNFADYIDENNTESADFLEAGDVEVRFDTEDITTHAKLLIVDDVVAVYSGNWSNNSLYDNHEAGAVVDGVETVTGAAETYFNTLWNTGVAWP